MKKIIVSESFSDAPGGRLESDGPKSGETFRNKILIPAFDELAENEVLLLDLDGTFGYATSFLEEAFGGLARIYEPSVVLKKLQFKSDEEPRLIQEITEYIKNAKG